MSTFAALLLAAAAFPQGTALGPIAEEHYLKASNPDVNDFFGRAVAIDGGTIVVGAPGEDSAATTVDGDQTDDSLPGAGAAYVFVRSGSTWIQQAYLKPSVAGGNFGSAVAISGDTIAVGSPNVHPGGSVTIFVRSGGTWTEQAHIVAPAFDSHTRFGKLLALDDDTLVVGGAVEELGGVAVYARSAGQWSYEATLLASNYEAPDLYGEALDVDGDTVVVGAYNEDNPVGGIDPPDGNDPYGLNAYYGAAYVFVRSAPGTWSQEAYLKPAQPQALMYFGKHLRLAGDLLAVSAPKENVYFPGTFAEPNVGTVRGFVRSNGVWSEVGTLTPPYPDEDENFGYGLVLEEDSIVVSSLRYAGIPVQGAGLAAFRPEAGTWLPTAIWAEGAWDPNRSGFGLVLDGDAGTLVVGLEYDSSAATGVDGDALDQSLSDSGAALVFGLAPPTPGAAVPRNAGSNPVSFAAAVPKVGQVWTSTVDLTTTGHPFAWITAFAAPTQLALPGGQTLLVDTTSSVEFLRLAPQPGPLAKFQLLMPSDLSLSGLPLFSQAVHLGGPQPLALSNALDLVLGN